MQRLVELALRYRVLVLLATLFVIVLGVVSLRNLPMDAEPDITPNQVLILTRAPSLSPLEVEQRFEAALSITPITAWGELIRTIIRLPGHAAPEPISRTSLNITTLSISTIQMPFMSICSFRPRWNGITKELM